MSKKESRFSWAKDKVLTADDFNIEDAVALIEDFIFSSSLTLIYSAPKQGKTWLAYAIAKYISNSEDIEEIHYLDMDNSISTLKERNVHKNLLEEVDNIFYETRSSIGMEPLEYLKMIADSAGRANYNGVLFILDTTKDFVDTEKPTPSKEFMRCCVKMRDAGATIIVLHHATKNKKQISGDQIFINTPDNVYSMKQIKKSESVIDYELTVTHARGAVKDCKWSVDTKSLELREYNPVKSGLSVEEQKYVELAIKRLKEVKDGLSMSALVESMGLGRTDRTGRRLVKELTNIYWRKEELSRNKHLYYLLGESND